MSIYDHRSVTYDRALQESAAVIPYNEHKKHATIHLGNDVGMFGRSHRYSLLETALSRSGLLSSSLHFDFYKLKLVELL